MGQELSVVDGLERERVSLFVRKFVYFLAVKFFLKKN